MKIFEMKLYGHKKTLSKVLICLSFFSTSLGPAQVNAMVVSQLPEKEVITIPLIPHSSFAAQSRNSTRNSLEFVALAHALGIKTIAQKIQEEGLVSKVQMELYERKLVLAQEGWLNSQKEGTIDSRDATNSINAVKDFLNLENKAVWPKQTNLVLFEFYRRLAVMDPVNKKQYNTEAAIRLKYLLLQQEVVAIPIELKSDLDRLAVRWIPFSSLDQSVVGVISSGFWYGRSSGRFPLIYDSSVELLKEEAKAKAQTPPQVLFQVVSISNQFYPSYAMVNLNDDDAEVEKKLTPKNYLQDSENQCRLLGIDGSPESEFIFLDQERCDSQQMELAKNQELSSFRISHHPIENNPFQNREPIQPVSRIKPWIWIAVGSLAATALVISSNSRRSAVNSSPSPSPVIHSTGW